MIHPSGLTTADYERCEVYPPNQAQIESTAWRVPDRDRYKRNRSWWLGYALLVLILLCASFGVLVIVVGWQ